MKRIEDKFIDLIADEGKELFNGETATNRLSAPLGTDLSAWIERVIVEEVGENYGTIADDWEDDIPTIIE